MATHSRSSRGPLERILGVVAEVRPGEATSALLLAANVFLLLFAYYLLKTVREALILSEVGAAAKTYLAAGQAVLLIVYARVFGSLARRFDRMRLLTFVTLFFASHLGLFFVLARAGISLGVPFFLWMGIFNVSLLAHFWSFANDIYAPEQGRRLFAVIATGAALGAVAGAYGARTLFGSLGADGLMLFALVLLLVTLVLTWKVHRREARHGHAIGAEAQLPVGGGHGAFRLVFAQRYLRLLAILTVLSAVVKTSGEYLFDRALVETVSALALESGSSTAQRIAELKGSFYLWTNALVLVFQLFAVSRIVKHGGMRIGLLLVPAVAAFGYSAIALLPLLPVLFVAKAAESSLDYSLQNTVRHALFLPTAREAKYKAKALIDTFFLRAGDVLAAGVILLATALGLGPEMLAVLVALLALGWLFTASATADAHRGLTGETPEPAPTHSPPLAIGR